MELIIKEVQLPEKIEWNYEELKTELLARAEQYASVVYTDETIKEAKADKAQLNKLKKALNDERIRREREYMKPFADFKTKVNEIIAIVDKPLQAIDAQVKDYEERQKKEKREAIEQFYDGLAAPSWLKLEQIFNPKWLNSSVKLSTVADEISEILNGIEGDLATLTMMTFAFEAKEEYMRTLDLNKAIAEGQRIADMQKRKQEEEERKAKERAEQVMKQLALDPDLLPHDEPVRVEVEVKNDGTGTVEQVKGPEPRRQWVSFTACLSVSEAYALKRFFDENGIEFHRI